MVGLPEKTTGLRGQIEGYMLHDGNSTAYISGGVGGGEKFGAVAGAVSHVRTLPHPRLPPHPRGKERARVKPRNFLCRH